MAFSRSPNTLLPWTVDIDTLQSVADTNWHTRAQDFSLYYSGYNGTSGAQNASISWDVVLSAGTWTIAMCHYKNTNVGIYSVQIDGVEVGTIDGYNGSAATNQESLLTGIVVGAPGKHRISLVMATKNASSSSYFGLLQHLQLRRTA